MHLIYNSELEMTRNKSPLNDEEAPPLEGPLATSDWEPSHASHRHRRCDARKILVLSAICLVIVACSFALGSSIGSASSSTAAANCAASGHPSTLQDSVSPEGPVDTTFQSKYDYRGHPRSITTSLGIVTADHGRCSELGASMLHLGGNAVDAAVATALCQGIYNPMASGIGGGHIMTIRLANGSSEVIDAREVAPLAATETMFKGNPRASLFGGLAIAVPLELRGLYVAHSRHGVLPWSQLVEPAAALAESGFEAHPYLVQALEMANFTGYPELQKTFLILDSESGVWRGPAVNETCCRRPQLAVVLRDVAAHGPDVLYSGKYAKQLVEDIQTAGGIISTEDLKAADAVVKQPLRIHCMGVDVIGPPPPSSASTIMTALLILAGYDLPLAGSGALGIHRTAEALKHAFALRMSLGDVGFVPDLDELLQDMLSTDFADELRGMTQDSGVLNATKYGGKWNVVRGGFVPEDHGTSHMNVVDLENNMAVALTSTINTGFGSKVMSPSTGILLNNQMDDFSTPGQPNIYGIPPSPSNFIRPGKKPFSSMSPLVVEQGGGLRMVVGASGGPRIISGVLQTLLRVLAYGEDAFSAVAGPRLHHQLLPDVLYAENWAAGSGVEFRYENETLDGLRARGHDVLQSAWGAVVQAVVLVENEGGGEDSSIKKMRMFGVSDPRKDGAPAGW